MEKLIIYFPENGNRLQCERMAMDWAKEFENIRGKHKSVKVRFAENDTAVVYSKGAKDAIIFKCKY